jgi:exodeoxyribonuclease VIII
METVTSLSPGVHKDIGWAQYLQTDALSRSDLVELSRSPARYRYRKDHPDDEETDAQLVGKAVHCAILEPARFEAAHAIGPVSDRRLKEWKVFEAEHPDAVCLTANQGAAIRGIAASIRAKPYVKLLLEHPGAMREVTLAWQLPDGTPCKGRLDILLPGPDVICDLKTTEDCSLFSFARTIASQKLHLQAAWYSWGYAATHEGRLPAYYCVAYERCAPYDAAVYRLTQEAINLGRLEIDFLLQVFAACQKSGQWPDLSGLPTDIGLPTWYTPDQAQLGALLESMTKEQTS